MVHMDSDFWNKVAKARDGQMRKLMTADEKLAVERALEQYVEQARREGATLRWYWRDGDEADLVVKSTYAAHPPERIFENEHSVTCPQEILGSNTGALLADMVKQVLMTR